MKQYAIWKFREYNELQHYFQNRIDMSNKPAEDYMIAYPSPLIQMSSHLISFIIGSLLLVIGVFSFINDDSLINITIFFGYSLVYIAGLLGIILTITTGLKRKVYNEAQKHLDKVSDYIHYRPETWKHAKSEVVYQEMSSLFQYRIVIFLKSILGIILGPFWILLILPRKIDSLLHYIADNTITDPDLGQILNHRYSKLILTIPIILTNSINPY